MAQLAIPPVVTVTIMKFSSRRIFAATMALGLGLGLTLAAPSAHAAKHARTVGLEAWRGQRVLLLLPLQLGEAFNVDRAFGTALLPNAEQNLQGLLEQTGKFSVVEAHRFNPILQRALSEKTITKDQLTALVDTPTLDNARLVLSKISFDRTPMIAQFVIEEVRLGGSAKDTSVQTQVSARLYEMGNPQALKTTVITSNAQRGGSVTESTQAALVDSFRRTVAEFVAPIEEIQLAIPGPAEPSLAPAPSETAPAPAEPVAAAPAPVVPTNNVTLPGDVSMAGASSRGTIGNGVPQLPSATPPLGINVPNAPTAER